MMGFVDEDPPTEETRQARFEADEHLMLIVLSGVDRGLRRELRPGTQSVGKSRQADMVLTDPAVSKHHLDIAVAGGVIEVRDVGSKNGSHYRGARFTSLSVGPGAVVRIGQSELLFAAISLSEGPGVDRLGRLHGRGPAMRKVFHLLQRFGRATLPLLITGETGTGKELAAEAAHALSPRRTGPFIVSDLAAISPSLIESELFGHVRGAFTGADRDRPGAFELAHRGTIFLDEIGELDFGLQPRLLRALDSGRVKRLGDDRYRMVDVRVIAATNRDLPGEVAAGRFRDDLYHRLAAAIVEIPPLRERLEDLSLLAAAVLAELSERMDRCLVMTPEAIDALAAYDWPGNVRQLRNVLERAAATSDADALTRVPLPIDGGRLDPYGAVVAAVTERHVDVGTAFKSAKQRLISEWEHDYLTTLLRGCGGNVSLAARKAGIDRVHFHRLLRKHDLVRSS